MNKKPKAPLGMALHEDAASFLRERAEPIQAPGAKEDLAALIFAAARNLPQAHGAGAE
jgi:hypothetical protein